MSMGTIYIVTASILWGLVHSILASHAFKRFVRKLFGAPAFYKLYRLSYNVFSVASFFPILLMVTSFPGPLLYSIPAPWLYISTIVQGLAVFILLAAVFQTDPMEFAGLAQLSAYYEDAQPARLVTNGMYAYVRHPLYSASLVFIWLTSDMSINQFVLWLILTLYIFIGAYFEERKLLKEFGAAYHEYKARTPMLFPIRLKRV